MGTETLSCNDECGPAAPILMLDYVKQVLFDQQSPKLNVLSPVDIAATTQTRNQPRKNDLSYVYFQYVHS